MDDDVTKQADMSDLIRKIHIAFPPNEYPGDEQIIPIRSPMDLEAIELLGAFKGKRWTDLTTETLLFNHDALSYFTPAGFRYYLPAFMLASITDWDSADIIPECVIFNLTAPSSTESGGIDFRDRLAVMSDQQKATIADFLEYLDKKHHHDNPPFLLPQESLEKFWKSVRRKED